MFAILTCEMAGIVGSLFIIDSITTWYIFLTKPLLSPPSWIFSPVWTVLYFLMGISLYLVWLKTKNPLKSFPIRLFGIHLGINTLWSIIFFGLKNSGLAFLEIIVLWITLVWIIKKFYKIDSRAGIILLPYLFWASFASYLNFAIWRLN